MTTAPAHRIALGDHLRELRRERGWASQGEFAHHAALDRTHIRGLERARRNPTLDVIVMFTQALDVHPAELLSTLP